MAPQEVRPLFPDHFPILPQPGAIVDADEWRAQCIRLDEKITAAHIRVAATPVAGPGDFKRLLPAGPEVF